VITLKERIHNKVKIKKKGQKNLKYMMPGLSKEKHKYSGEKSVSPFMIVEDE